MIYLVEIEGKTDLKVDLSESRRGVWTARVDQHRAVEMEFRGQDADGAYVVLVDGKPRKFRLSKNCTRYMIDDGAQTSRFQVEHAAEVVLEHDRQTDTSWEFPVDRLESSITGIVLEVLVRPGERVEPGQPIVLIEAMKMENTLSAPISATVADVAVTAGQTVYAGDELVRFM